MGALYNPGGGVGGVENAWMNLPQVSFVAVRFPWRVRPGIAVFAVITRLAFPCSLVGSLRWRG